MRLYALRHLLYLRHHPGLQPTLGFGAPCTSYLADLETNQKILSDATYAMPLSALVPLCSTCCHLNNASDFHFALLPQTHKSSLHTPRWRCLRDQYTLEFLALDTPLSFLVLNAHKVHRCLGLSFLLLSLRSFDDFFYTNKCNNIV